MYNLNLNYIPAQELIREVKNELSTYFEKGALDNSYLYPTIRTCLSKMGLKILPVKKTFLKLDEGRVELPCDFYKVELAIGCGLCESTDVDYLNPQLREYYVSGVNVCETDCDYCSDSCGNLFSIIQTYNTFSATYSNLFPLRIAGCNEYCSNDCLNHNQRYWNHWEQANEITIRNGYIYANFKVGHIYLEYMTNLESDDGDLLIPDQQTIKDWIKHEMMFVCFRKLYLNQEGDFVQRLNWIQQQLAIYQTNAQSIYKRWEVKEIYDLRKVLRSRFKKFNTAVYGRWYDNPTSMRTPEHRRGDFNYYDTY